jgi:hypothetical protein
VHCPLCDLYVLHSCIERHVARCMREQDSGSGSAATSAVTAAAVDWIKSFNWGQPNAYTAAGGAAASSAASAAAAYTPSRSASAEPVHAQPTCVVCAQSGFKEQELYPHMLGCWKCPMCMLSFPRYSLPLTPFPSLLHSACCVGVGVPTVATVHVWCGCDVCSAALRAHCPECVSKGRSEDAVRIHYLRQEQGMLTPTQLRAVQWVQARAKKQHDALYQTVVQVCVLCRSAVRHTSVCLMLICVVLSALRSDRFVCV